MKYTFMFSRRAAGFTLVEMAVVLAIVALLLGGLLPTISSQIEQQRRSEVRKQMDEIQQALMGYAIVNGRLPCPAKATIATGSPSAGMFDCTLSPLTGVVPWATLGTSETDAWGRRFTYTVSSTFATSSFILTSTGTLTVKNAAAGINIASNIPAVFVSHGTNGLGAYTSQGTPIAASSDPDEADNSNGGTTFVSHYFVQNGFDDLVVWISPNVLMNRMVAAGKLP